MSNNALKLSENDREMRQKLEAYKNKKNKTDSEKRKCDDQANEFHPKVKVARTLPNSTKAEREVCSVKKYSPQQIQMLRNHFLAMLKASPSIDIPEIHESKSFSIDECHKIKARFMFDRKYSLFKIFQDFSNVRERIDKVDSTQITNCHEINKIKRDLDILTNQSNRIVFDLEKFKFPEYKLFIEVFPKMLQETQDLYQKTNLQWIENLIEESKENC